MAMKTIADIAHGYIADYGWHLVPIEPGRKFPTADDWGNTALSDPDAAREFYGNGATDWNMGLALGPSRMCSLDLDHEVSFQTIMAEYGIPQDALDGYPTIVGRGRRIMFRVPDGVDLPYVKLNWPREDDPKKHFTVFELRASCDGKQRQDVLPPSIHPDTGKPYIWSVPPPDPWQEWPEPPGWLLAIWTAWASFKPQFVDCCPWAEKKPSPVARAQKPRDANSQDVIGMYNDQHQIAHELERYGYQRKGRRYLSPHSSTGLPGVVLFDDNRCWIHHASDPLCSEDTGQPVNPFDLFCYYDHGNDPAKAVKAACELLGIKRERKPLPAQTVTDQSEQALQARSESSAGVDYNWPLPWCNDKGRPLKHIDNLREICRRLGVTIRYNVISKEEEIIIPGQRFTIDNEANASLAWLESECSLFGWPTEKLPSFVTYLADQNPYNPVAAWIDSRPWDNVSRLQSLFDTVVAKGDDQSLKETLMKRWMIAAVAAACAPAGISAPGVLVFQGAQYLGKTKWFKSLVPSHLGLVKDGLLLRPDDKDSVKQACSFWLVELGELDSTFRKADIAQLKSFITMDKDVLRRAYARRESHYARRTMFFGSVNPREFLHDQTGNRRYWTIECESIDHSHMIDMQQVWAEVKMMWLCGEGYYLTPSEMAALNAHNEGFMAADPIEEKIMTRLDWSAPRALWEWITATEALALCGLDRPSRAETTTAAMVIRKANNGEGRRSNGKSLLLCPPKL